MAQLRAVEVDIGCPRSYEDANPRLSDTNTQVPFINPQNCPLSSSLPAFTSPLMLPLGQGLGLGSLCFSPSDTSGCGHTGTHLSKCTAWLPGERSSKCSLNANCSYLCIFNTRLGSSITRGPVITPNSTSLTRGFLTSPALPSPSHCHLSMPPSCNSLLPGLPLLPSDPAQSPAMAPVSLKAKVKSPRRGPAEWRNG